MSADKIFRYFNDNYGEVEYVSIHVDAAAACRFALMEFGLESSANKASAERQHSIGGCTVDVATVDEVHTQTNILDLPDDCLSPILDNLGLEDLSMIASVCTQLRYLAQDKFTTKFRDHSLSMMFKSAENVSSCLRHFGSPLQSITYVDVEQPESNKRRKRDSTYVLHLLLNHCPSLKYLKMGECRFQNHGDHKQLLPLFSRLDTLILEKCKIYSDLFTFFDVPELVLNVFNIYDDRARKRSLTRVKTLKFGSNCDAYGPYFLHHMRQPTSVECLEIGVRASLRNGLCVYKEILNFENLKTLKMHIHQARTSKTMGIVERLTHLSELVWGYPDYFDPSNLLEMVRTGRNLKQLTVIFKSEGWSEAPANVQHIYHEILYIVLERPAVQPLRVTIIGNRDQIYPFNVLLPEEAVGSLEITCIQIRRV